MYKVYHRNGYVMGLVVRHHTLTRLATTCFRGTDVEKSGNFRKWTNFYEMWEDGDVLMEFLRYTDLLMASDIDPAGHHRWTGRYFEPVGWASTVPPKELCDKGAQYSFEKRNVKASQTRQLFRNFVINEFAAAPLTHLFTFVFEIRSENGQWSAIIHSVYPGADAGELNNKATAEQKERVFFDFGNPGAVMWICDK